jgi:AraC family transcriptional regulator of adaptative response/methylated-DNA-[protein]-cysteine methyltransferase
MSSSQSQHLASQHIDAVINACRLIDQAIERAEKIPDLDALAESAGISRFHFHRVFKLHTGITPKAYASAQRAKQLRDNLSHTQSEKNISKIHSMTDAALGAGFNSSTQFYAQSEDILGMPAKRFRAGGEKEIIRFAVGQCSLGAILVAATGKGICAILIDDDPEYLLRNLQDRFPAAQLIGADNEFEEWIAKVVGFVESPNIGLDLPLDIRGTTFQQRVWQALREIPVGSTVSYSDIAAKIGAPKAVRAVASACASNHIALAIPCHRVVRIGGDLSGYRWGIERKRELLMRESSRELESGSK